MATHSEWRRAYARQARADLIAREALRVAVVPRCQELHFLQMACEKIVKAHLFLSDDVPGYVNTSHAVIVKHLPRILQEYYSRLNDRSMPRHVNQRMKALARAIELLAPAVRGSGQHVVNCEYPWLHGDTVYTPADYEFRELELTRQSGATFLLKLLPIIAGDLSD